MLKNKIKYVFIVLFTITSCQLTGELDEVDSGFLVTPEVAIRDAASAEAVLVGVYSRFRKTGFQSLVRIGAYWGISGIVTSAGFTEISINTNAPQTDNSLITSFYLNCYQVISQVNSLNTGLNNLSTDKISDAERNTLLGESAFLKASAYFYALRFFGQHYDLTSSYGIVLRPGDSDEVLPRSSVQDSYTAILENLDFAIANAPANGGPNYRASKEAAQALKAKVLLFMGDYPGAAILANTVLTNTTKSFEPDYAAMFEHQTTSTEVFFAPYIDLAEDGNGSFRPLTLGGSIYETLATAAGDPRLNTLKFWLQFDPSRTTNVHLRLPELYLIHAEAAARAGSAGVDAAALASLNASRTRAAVGLSALVATIDVTTKAELLEAIRMEKLFELFSEQGEEFLDIVRYHSLGDLNGLSIKTSLNSEHLFILPIPIDEINASLPIVIDQNPEY